MFNLFNKFEEFCILVEGDDLEATLLEEEWQKDSTHENISAACSAAHDMGANVVAYEQQEIRLPLTILKIDHPLFSPPLEEWCSLLDSSQVEILRGMVSMDEDDGDSRFLACALFARYFPEHAPLVFDWLDIQPNDMIEYLKFLTQCEFDFLYSSAETYDGCILDGNVVKQLLIDRDNAEAMRLLLRRFYPMETLSYVDDYVRKIVGVFYGDYNPKKHNRFKLIAPLRYRSWWLDEDLAEFDNSGPISESEVERLVSFYQTFKPSKRLLKDAADAAGVSFYRAYLTLRGKGLYKKWVPN